MATKNLTVSLSTEEHGDLEMLVDFFQQRSISTVTKSDVIKFMLKQMKIQVEKDKVNDVRDLLSE